MSTIKHYEQEGNGEYVPVGSSKVYTQEEYWEMLSNGTWQGGNVVGLGYVMGETVIDGSSPGSEDSDSDSEISFSDDGENDTPGGGNQGGGNSGGGGGSAGGGGGAGSGGSAGGGGGNSGGGGSAGGGGGAGSGGSAGGGGGNSGGGSASIQSSSIDNAGEAYNSYLHIYTEDEANSLMDSGKWMGGYVIGFGYLGPEVVIVSSDNNLPTSGLQILDNALEFINTPYKYGGDNKFGIDCSGLVSAALRLDIHDRWSTASGDIPGMRKILLSNNDENFTSELQKGDILVWRADKKHKNGHAVFFVEGSRIFHAHGNTGDPTGYTDDLIRYWYKERGVPDVYRK